jgi:hypothetical protein
VSDMQKRTEPCLTAERTVRVVESREQYDEAGPPHDKGKGALLTGREDASLLIAI